MAIVKDFRTSTYMSIVMSSVILGQHVHHYSESLSVNNVLFTFSIATNAKI
jgi:hypothetical protein